MIESKVICPACGETLAIRYTTHWLCGGCGQKFPCVQGIPKLCLPDAGNKGGQAPADRKYNSLLGSMYDFFDPYLLLPLRPIGISLQYWFIYFLQIFLFGFLVYSCADWLFIRGVENTRAVDVLLLGGLASYIWFLVKYPEYAWLLVLSIPVKISLSIKRFQPAVSHPSVHAAFLQEYLASPDRLQLLDVSTGSSNALLRHGYMTLNADITAIDLSETMILQGVRKMAAQQAPVDFFICDVTRLPFESDTFDIVTCYGAVNGYADPQRALAEMTRVTKKGGKMLFLDEQMYESASWLERLYFTHVMTRNNTTAGCPVHLLPEEIVEAKVHQVREFIYICTGRKNTQAAVMGQ